MKLTDETTVRELCAMPDFSHIRDLVFTHMDEEKRNSRLGEYGTRMAGLFHALYYTAGFCAKEDFVLPLYSAEEQEQNPEKREVLLLNFAIHPGRPYVMICPGGGYNREWVLVEGYPLADEINRLGYNAFILIYRTGRFGLFPDPLEDLARAVDYVRKNAGMLCVDPEGYALTGASAGGHLISQWGTKNNGYERYGLEKPAALLMTYPAAVCTSFFEAWEKAKEAGDTAVAEGIAPFLKRIGGENFTREKIASYSLETCIDGDYPRTWLIHCEDDPTVPAEISFKTLHLFERYGVAYDGQIVKHGGHSFGLGIGTDAEGWIEKAVDFWRKGREENALR